MRIEPAHLAFVAFVATLGCSSSRSLARPVPLPEEPVRVSTLHALSKRTGLELAGELELVVCDDPVFPVAGTGERRSGVRSPIEIPVLGDGEYAWVGGPRLAWSRVLSVPDPSGQQEVLVDAGGVLLVRLTASEPFDGLRIRLERRGEL